MPWKFSNAPPIKWIDLNSAAKIFWAQLFKSVIYCYYYWTMMNQADQHTKWTILYSSIQCMRIWTVECIIIGNLILTPFACYLIATRILRRYRLLSDKSLRECDIKDFNHILLPVFLYLLNIYYSCFYNYVALFMLCLQWQKKFLHLRRR